MQKLKRKASSSRTGRFRLALLFFCGLVIALGLAWRVVDATTLGSWAQQLTVILEHPSETDAKTPILDETPLTLPSPPLAPARILVLQDKSGSIDEHRVESPDAELFRALAEILIPSGGELAASSICSDSDRPFSRVRIEQPPLFDPAKLRNPISPIQIDDNQNAFARRQDQHRYKQELETYAADRSEDRATIDAHDQATQAHEDEARAQIQTFIANDLASLLSASAHCQETDIYGALARANLFFNEPTESWRTEPDLFLIVVSDGLHTTDTEPVALTEEVKVLLVNGSGSKGVFASIDHLAFESFDAAALYLTTTAQQ